MDKIGLIGAGRVGSVLCEHLIKSYNECFCLVASGLRKDKLLEKGILINGNTIFPRVISESKEPLDLVIICVKNHNLVDACEDIRGSIDEHTVILPLLNGISPTPSIQKAYPKNLVLYGYITKIDSYKDNEEFKYNIAGEIHFGEANNSTPSPMVQRILEILQCANLDAKIDIDMISSIWKKWMLNAGANQVSALTGMNYLHFSRIPEAEFALRLVMEELLDIAIANQVNLSKRDIDDLIEYLTHYPFPKKTSMLLDIESKMKTEIEYISGDVVKIADSVNVPCPNNRLLYYLIRSKERTYLDIV